MNTKTSGKIARRLMAGLGAILLAVIVSGCDSSGGVVPTDGDASAGESFELLTADLGLSEHDAAAIASKMDGFETASVDAPDPGFIWELAAHIHASLTDEQLDRLMDRLESAREAGFIRGPGAGMHGGPAGGRGLRPGGRPGAGPGGGGLAARRTGVMRALQAIDLTDEQKEEIRSIHESRRAEVRALLEQRGSMDAQTFREQMEALRDEIRSGVESVLTAAQLQQLETFRQQAEERRAERQAVREARRAESRAAMADVLGLTDEQLGALDELRTERDEWREAMQELFDSGADRAELREYLAAEREAHRETIMQIVDERQYEIMQIHAFLAGRFAARRAAGINGPGGPGTGNGPNRQGMRPGGGQGFGPGGEPGTGSGLGPDRLG